MKRNKKLLCMICVACAVSVLFFYDRHEACTYRLKVIETENGNGYGYQIFCGDRVVICQPYIPSLPGRKGFALEEDARKVGNLVLERIRQGNDFTISVADLKGQGITGD